MKPNSSDSVALLKICGGIFFVCALGLLFLLAGPRTALGQGMPLEDKAKYERSLEVKVEEVLMKLLGPNQAKVVVQASMDFTRTEKVDMTSSQPAAGAEKEGVFKWDGSSSESKMFSEYLLPGFPNMGGSGKPENTTYQKQMLYPASFINKLVVAVILNKELPDNEAQAVRNVVSEILSLDPKRGDELSIIKTPFAPFWRTIWYTPEAMNLVFRYIILTIMGVIALVVVAIGFLKLAGAMNTMAKAQQSHQITMDLGKGIGGGGLPGGGGGAGEGLSLGGSSANKLDITTGERKERESSDDGAPQKVVFNVGMDQLGFLVSLMANEDAANVALVATHLDSDVRNKFLSMLPSEAASEVISQMAKVRFVEPDIINTIKEELERRLSGALGGLQQVIDILEKVDLRAKRDMLEKLAKKDPDTARQVRKKIFLPEDLGLLSDRDMSLVIGNFKVETLAAAVVSFAPSLKHKIRKQMAEKTWQMVEQTMKYGAPSREMSEKAVEELVEAVLKLIAEGRVSNPLDKEQIMISGQSASAELKPELPVNG